MSTKIVPLMVFSLVAVVAVAAAASAQGGDRNAETPRWLEVSYDLELDETMSELTLSGRVDIRKVSADNALLRYECGGSTCTADDLRSAYEKAGDSGRDQIVEGIESTVEQRVRSALATMAEGEDPVVSANVSRAALQAEATGDPHSPPIPVNATGTASLGLLDAANVTPEQARALFQMGARITQPIEQQVQAGTNLTLELSLADHVAVLETSEGQLDADDGSVGWSVTNWASEEPTRIEDVVRIGDPNVQVPQASDANVGVTLDIADVDIDYGQLVTGDPTASAELTLSVDGRFQAIENPQPLERVELDYLSADAVRLALEHDLIPREQLLGLEEGAREQMEKTLAGMTGEPVEVEGGFGDDLSSASIGEPVGSGEAIELELSADARVPFPPEEGADGSPPGAVPGFTVTTLPLGEIELPRPEVPGDVATTFSLVLPAGLALDYVAPDGYEVEERTVDGRQAYTFAASDEGGGDGAVRIQDSELVVNHPFVWNLFWPLLLALVLLLVVLSAVVIGLTIRRRRKHGPPRSEETAAPVSGSQATQRPESEEA